MDGPNVRLPLQPPSARDRIEATLVRRALAARPLARRWLAGRAIVRDGVELDPEMQVMLRLMRLARSPDYASFGPPEARREADRQARAVSRPVGVARIGSFAVSGAAGPLPARLYRPDGAERTLLVYLHGGGHVIGGAGTHDTVARYVATRARVNVLLPDYRLAPEHRFPAAVDDAIAVYRWARANAAALGADRVFVGGDSAGGNLAAVVAQAERGPGGPDAQWLVYPMTDCRADTPSRSTFAEGFFLTEQDIAWYRSHYLGPDGDADDPRVSPLRAPDLRGVAPAAVITAGFDPLRDEGEAYARALKAAGVPVTLRRAEGLIHGFANLVGVSAAARAAMDASLRDLRGVAGSER